MQAGKAALLRDFLLLRRVIAEAPQLVERQQGRTAER
jgi:hypothetical protein